MLACTHNQIINSPKAVSYTHLYDLYLPALRNDITIILANRYLPEENIDFLSEFYTCAFLSYFTHKCEQRCV